MSALLGYAILALIVICTAFLYRRLFREIRDSKRPWWMR